MKNFDRKTFRKGFARQLCCVLGKYIKGLWQEVPIDLILSDEEQDMFELGLLYAPQLGGYLRYLKCRYDFLEKMFLNVETLGELILEIYCNEGRYYVWMDDMPPEEIEYLTFNPIDGSYK